MGLGRLRGRHEVEERGWQSWWNQAGAPGLISSAAYGMTGIEQALMNPASHACINVLASALARTPIDVLRGRGNRAKPVDPLPSLIADPSGVVAADVWLYQCGYSMVTDGNVFGRVTSMSGAGWPNTIELLDSNTVTDRKVVAGIPQVKVDNAVHRLHPFGDIWHCPGGMVPAGTPFARSPVNDAADVIATSLAAQTFSRQFFTDGGHPSSIIYSNKDLNAQQAQEIKNAWRRATSGNREAAVLGGDLKHEQIQVNPGDSQFIDLMRWSVEDVCRIWGVPPSMVYGAVSGESVTYANVTDADLAFLKHSLDNYFVRLETALTDLLPRPQYVKFNRNAILRTDVTARYASYETGIRNGWLNRNEIRDFEDMTPIAESGDEYVWPPVGKGAGMDVRPPAAGGVVTENPGGATVTPSPVAPVAGNGKTPPVGNGKAPVTTK